jgi:hypothetical protein
MKTLTRRLVVSAVVVLAVVASAELLLDRPWSIDNYHVLDDHTLVVTTGASWLTWTRVTSIVETPTSVTIGMKSFWLPLPAAGTGGPSTEFTVSLRDAIDDRVVMDASTDEPIFHRTFLDGPVPRLDGSP